MATYGELHAHSGFSFLDGASDPEELVVEATRLGLSGLALCDHHGLYGVVRFSEAARALGLASVFGSEITLDALDDRVGVPDPSGDHLVVLARSPEGYASLSRMLALALLERGEKGAPRLNLDEVASAAREWLVLTGCRKGPLTRALMNDGPRAASRSLAQLIERFGRDNVAVEIWDHGEPDDVARNDVLAELARRAKVSVVATNNVHYATPHDFPRASVLAAIRARQSLDEMEGWQSASPLAHLRSDDEQRRRFARWPGVVDAAGEFVGELAFDLRLVAPNLPAFKTPEGHDEQSYLEEIVAVGATQRYGTRENERVPGAWRQIDHELSVIKTLGFAGYFLTVWDITEFCRKSDIYCQGRGSAANSAVCYSLGITNADAVSLNLFFERFLSPARDGPPDIDVDIESGRREEVIQYVFDRYDRHHAAQVAAVITYRSKSALRDVARAFGHSEEEANYIRDHVDRATMTPGDSGVDPIITTMAAQLRDRPRHLGIHSAGMVLCDRPVLEVCPVEWGRMPGRSVLQWDKDDCAAIGLVKFDLLGLGMLEALHRAVDVVQRVPRCLVGPGDAAPRRRRLRPVVRGRHRRGLPGGVARADGDAAARPAALLLRHRDRGGPHSSRSHSGPRGEPLHSPAPRRRARHLPAPSPPADPRAHARGAALPRAAHGDGRGGGRLLAERVRRTAPGHGVEALGTSHDETEEPLLLGHGPERHRGRGGRSALRRVGGLCELRLSRVARGLLRPPRLLLGLDQGALPGGVSRLAPQRSAHGLLVAPESGRRRPAPRGDACCART